MSNRFRIIARGPPRARVRRVASRRHGAVAAAVLHAPGRPRRRPRRQGRSRGRREVRERAAGGDGRDAREVRGARGEARVRDGVRAGVSGARAGVPSVVHRSRPIEGAHHGAHEKLLREVNRRRTRVRGARSAGDVYRTRTSRW